MRGTERRARNRRWSVRNILNPELSQVGIGVANKNGELYITVDFVGY